MTSEKILTETHGSVLEVTLNNPEKLNCMGFEMLTALDEAVSKAASEEEIKALLIRGAGERAFSTGADLKEFQSLPTEKADEWIEYGNEVFNRIEELPKPSIALIKGYAVGGGLELALSCDFRIGAETAVLACVELQHGWLPGWGGMTRLRRLIGEARAKEMVMLCEKIPAGRALEMGLLHRVYPEDVLKTELDKLFDHLCGLNSEAFKLAKAVLMDPNRTTGGVDVQFDVMAMKIANTKPD
jgi:enoyl-CoA hydratase/carnithine racemase